MVEDYGIEFITLLFQYSDFVEGISQAAEYINAQLLFALLAKSNIPFWDDFQNWTFFGSLRVITASGFSIRFMSRNLQRPVYESIPGSAIFPASIFTFLNGYKSIEAWTGFDFTIYCLNIRDNLRIFYGYGYLPYAHLTAL